MSRRFTVYFAGGDLTSVEFDDLKEARRYARRHGGMIWDNDQQKVVYDYMVAGIDY